MSRLSAFPFHPWSKTSPSNKKRRKKRSWEEKKKKRKRQNKHAPQQRSGPRTRPCSARLRAIAGGGQGRSLQQCDGTWAASRSALRDGASSYITVGMQESPLAETPTPTPFSGMAAQQPVGLRIRMTCASPTRDLLHTGLATCDSHIARASPFPCRHRAGRPPPRRPHTFSRSALWIERVVTPSARSPRSLAPSHLPLVRPLAGADRPHPRVAWRRVPEKKNPAFKDRAAARPIPRGGSPCRACRPNPREARARRCEGNGHTVRPRRGAGHPLSLKTALRARPLRQQHGRRGSHFQALNGTAAGDRDR